LDGTLVSTDTLHESLLKAIRTHGVSLIPRLISNLPRSRGAFKGFVAEFALPFAATLPYNPEVLAYLQEARASGREVWLVTAAHQRIADVVAAHLQLFDRVIATAGDVNIKGPNKVLAIRSALGDASPFAYLGDSRSDLAIWGKASERVGVFPSGCVPRWASRVTFDRVITRASRPLELLRLMRPHQWLKNLLLFVPLFLAHRWGEVGDLLSVGRAIASFCAAASAVYILNDLLDIEADRAHPTKSARPLASGQVGITTAMGAATLLLAVSGLLAFSIGAAFGAVIIAYLAVTTIYSFHLKQLLLLDVFCLAGLYATRIFAGGVAVGAEVSNWLLAFAMFFFLSLGFAKRFAELYDQPPAAALNAKRRDYSRGDMATVMTAGISSGTVSVLVFVLYLQSQASLTLYPRQQLLWLIAPLLLYWVLRLWFFASRGSLHQDPVVFAATDRVTALVGVVIAAVVVVASVGSGS
jgi:4-hydroxybenzoate polyprenyltransferase